MKQMTWPALSLVLLAAPAGAADGKPAVVFVKQIVEDGKADLRLDWVNTIRVHGDFVLATSHRDGRVNVFRRDVKTGDLKYLNFVDLAVQLGRPGTHLDAFPVLAGDNFLYVTGAWTHAHGNADGLGLRWYKFDPKDGPTRLLGAVPCDAGRLQTTPDGKGLILSAGFSSAFYPITLDGAGKPTVGAKVAGKGLGDVSVPSPDGKQLYSVSDGAIGRVDVGTDGSVAYGGSCDLSALKPKPELRAQTVAVSPDGRHVYAALWTYKYNALGLFNRDAKTGALTFAEELKVDPNMVGINHIVFTADGKTGYYTSSPENSGACLGWFSRDPETGRLAFGGVAEKSKVGPNDFGLAADGGTIYMAGNWNTRFFNIYRVK